MVYPYNFRGIWERYKIYNKYDIVLHENSIYMALIDIDIHNNNLNKKCIWQVISRGIVYKSKWKNNICYYENNIVKYNEDIYICIKDNKNINPDINSECWELFISKGKNNGNKCNSITNKGEWNGCYRYKINDIVRYNNCVYIALLDNIHKNPENNNLFWGLLVKDGKDCKCNNEYLKNICNKQNITIKHLGKWKNNINYVKGDIIRYSNMTFMAKCNNKNNEPKECSENWGLISKDCNNCDRYGYSKIFHATINNGLIIDEEYNISSSLIEKDDNNNICIDIQQKNIELQLKVIEYNTDYYYVENDCKMNIFKLLFNKCGKYRIIYNIKYISPVNFNICAYLNGDTYLNTGHGICHGTIYEEDRILNHSFYINIKEEDIKKVFKLYYINMNNEDENINKILIDTSNSWITIEYTGL